MKRFSKILCFMVVFMVMIATMCTISFAQESQYTDNLIPKMTSNNSPSGIASASDSHSSIPAWKAFDKNYIYYAGSAGYNAWGTTKKYGWLAYEFTSPKIINKYTIQTDFSGFNISSFPKDWTFEGTNNGIDWEILDTRSNITNWTSGVKKEFYFDNYNTYIKYRINISSNVGGANYEINLTIAELEMMGPTTIVQNPTNLMAKEGNSKVYLSWNAVPNATSYNIKRATTVGGIYTTIATSSAITFTDTTVTNGNTYYYVVSAVTSNGQSPNSNEVSSIPQAINQLKLVLEVNENKQISISDDLDNNTEMRWTSSDSTIATVDENGRVKALKPGNTVITCTSEDYTESINLLVVDLEYQLAVDLNVGDSCRLTVDDLANATNVVWSSYDSTIATVTAKGKVTAISEGLIYIVATDKAGKEIGRIYIRVRK